MREALLVLHAGRESNRRTAVSVAARLADAGIGIRVLSKEWDELAGELSGQVHRVEPTSQAADGAEVVLALGGDGTMLRAAELARSSGVPLLGVNLGRVGFLAEADQESLDEVISAIVERSYRVEERMTVDALLRYNGEVLVRTWALNEAVVEKTLQERVLEVVLEIEGRPVSSFGCDGVLCATPTGSTAYAFSTGGPVVWPQVQALLIVPSNAHALFARPLVIPPESQVAVETESRGQQAALVCDGRRTFTVPPGARVELTTGELPVRLARLRHQPFADRLVRKFNLPVHGWRGAPSRPQQPGVDTEVF